MRIFPADFVAEAVDRLERRPEVAFSEVVKAGAPVVDQAEAWAKSAGIALEPGWKVELSKRVKQQVLAKGISQFDDALIDRWANLFAKFADGPSGRT